MIDGFRFRCFDREDFIALSQGESSAMLSPHRNAVNRFVYELGEAYCSEPLFVASFSCFLIASGNSPVCSQAVETWRNLIMPSASIKI